ncbi:MAG: tyrosine-type recombinase/integrase, partial [Pseudomonadota bacterium]
AVRKAKLSEAFRFHDLRHTFASWHIMSGTGPKAVQELMRHKSFKSTERYLHLTKQHLQDAADNIDFGELPTAAAPKVKKCAQPDPTYPAP